MLGVADGLFCIRVHIEQPFYLPSADDVFADYFFRIFGSDLRIEGIVGDNLNNRSFLAEAEASGGDYIYLVGNLVFLECLLKFFSDDMAGGCLASVPPQIRICRCLVPAASPQHCSATASLLCSRNRSAFSALFLIASKSWIVSTFIT